MDSPSRAAIDGDPRRRRLSALVAAFISAASIATLDVSIVNVALPHA